ncbi:MAG TPA: hypothetical protein VLE91_00075 [Candidatus Saccharimonadales bacterium]|nr:hypothetical protein [Candidatus Saccharimonadales bacterium]
MERYSLKDKILLRGVREEVFKNPELVVASFGYGVYSHLSLELGSLSIGAAAGYFVGRHLFQEREARGLDRNRTDV